MEPMRFQVSVSARFMSLPGLKSTESSLPPRIVLERTWATPMTLLTACSSGCVTWTSMLATPRAGTFATTPMRGKVTSG